jgi:hypothetical protein
MVVLVLREMKLGRDCEGFSCAKKVEGRRAWEIYSSEVGGVMPIFDGGVAIWE